MDGHCVNGGVKKLTWDSRLQGGVPAPQPGGLHV